MKDILEIASKHLGKAGDGTVVKPYETPKKIDASLLVAIPRYLNRTLHNIVDYGKGFDIWNAYEFSCLAKNNAPFNAIITLEYSSDSNYIVESKSLKLYLNSFNMNVLNVEYSKVSETVKDIISKDLSNILETEVLVFVNKTSTVPENIFESVENIDYLLEENMFDLYDGEEPSLLKINEIYGKDQFDQFYTSTLRSNCRVTNQPDWGDICVMSQGKLSIDKVSFLRYILSLRNENHFHEEIVELVYKRLTELLPENSIIVMAQYTRRGGIDINPIRTNIEEFAKTVIGCVTSGLLLKTPRQ